MRQAYLIFAFLIWASQPASAQTGKPREVNPLAPSLPLLSDKEEEKIDNTIDRFIQYDMGQLRGEEGKKALQEFRRLGPETIPGMIRGLNRAAKIESSCPAVTIAKKLAVMLRASNDPELLDFARENIGAGITQSRHMAVIKDLRLLCILRKRAVGNNPVIVRTPPRQDQEPITLAVPDAPPVDPPKRDTKSERTLRSLSTEALKDKLKDTDAAVRATAARIVGSKRLPLGAELIDLLSDDAGEVSQAAHQSLVRLNRGTDLGPAADADETERAAAIKKWREWWAKQN